MKTLISILSGDIWNDASVWRTNDLDVRYGAVRSIAESFRMPAAAEYILQQSKDGACVVVVQGGLADATYPSLASVMKRELVELGVPERIVELEDTSQTTYQQLFKLQDMATAQQPATVAIVSSEWHIPRIQTMIEHVPGLAALRALNPTCVAAEAVLLKTDPARWGKKVEAVRVRTDTKASVALEQKGIGQILDGTYHFR